MKHDCHYFFCGCGGVGGFVGMRNSPTFMDRNVDDVINPPTTCTYAHTTRAQPSHPALETENQEFIAS